jgi:hypothetical protein
MDEFAEFEMELNRDSSSIGAEDIIAEIEEMDEIPDYVFHREEKLYPAQFKKAFLRNLALAAFRYRGVSHLDEC